MIPVEVERREEGEGEDYPMPIPMFVLAYQHATKSVNEDERGARAASAGSCGYCFPEEFEGGKKRMGRHDASVGVGDRKGMYDEQDEGTPYSW